MRAGFQSDGQGWAKENDTANFDGHSSLLGQKRALIVHIWPNKVWDLEELTLTTEEVLRSTRAEFEHNYFESMHLGLWGWADEGTGFTRAVSDEAVQE